MFNQLSDKLEGVFKNLRGQGKLSERNIKDAMTEVRLALLEADVDYSVARDFISSVRDEAMGEKVLKSVTPGQQIVKIFRDKLAELLGGDQAPLELTPPARILMVGLNGAGKTTTSAKLALRLKKEGRRPLLVACDLFRPAAIDQLETLAREIDVPVFTPDRDEKNVIKVAKQALKWAETQNGTVMIFDTAGRQEIDDALIRELEDLQKFLQAKEVLLVADSATGQQAVNVAKRFDEAVGISGIVLTKLDGDARGGAALSMRSVTGKPIKFSGVGEKIADFEAFVPDRLADRMLGMGDVVGLVEKAAEAVDEKDAMKMAERLASNQFDFNDFLQQMKFMKKLGPMENILGMLPGVGKKLKDINVDDGKMKRIEAIVLSMTPYERSRPEIINAKRRKRIAAGSGTNLTQVNQLLKQFSMMRKMMKNKGKMKGMMKQMGMGGGGFPGLPGGGKLPF
ncbi:signal recognition particle protein [Sulfuriroseicoccus oceanibius]|uniref:Signal recognition particle protein n=1 Tax=Sulfuriroseicoccus oceanibius TaxID=2707525 RepID=A0A6B3LDN8_9BACT|nr:signal recognition particle protein [Sulfuriroseicoccus oceanibius]QQL45701.1 signal recognition particle protein [Sulfuriroseicoccus oceanibius]